MAKHTRPLNTWLLVVVSLVLANATVHAQSYRDSPWVGIGYVASVPITPFGFAALGVTPSLFGGAGLYADVKFTTGSPGDSPYYIPGATVFDAEVTWADRPFQDESDWFSVNLAAVYAITGDFLVYGGAGYSKEEHYREFFDETEERGNLGFYWVYDADNSGDRVNVLGGTFFRLTRIVLFQAGAQSAPLSATVGLTIAFPL